MAIPTCICTAHTRGAISVSLGVLREKVKVLDVPCYERRYRCSYAEVGVYLMYGVSGCVESWRWK